MLAGSGVGLVVGLGVTGYLLWQRPGVRTWVMERSLEGQLRSLQEPGTGGGPAYEGPVWEARGLASGEALYDPMRIWEGHLRFTAEQWEGLGPVRIPSMPDWLGPDGTPRLRNPHAARPGVAGVFGFDLPWSRGDFEFGGVVFTNVGARFKGNGTFLAGLRSYRRPFKLDLNRHVRGQRLAGRSTLNLHNLEADRSFLSDTLGYEFFRDAGVPAPRTTFLRLYLGIEGRWERELLGLYLMVENPDAAWLRSAFGVDGVALYKPVTPELFDDLGDDWAAYAAVYDPKTKPDEGQQRRLMELCRWATRAEGAAFEEGLEGFFDLDALARFFAALCLTASYDSVLDNGQNMLFWHDPRTDRFGFSPWDLDHSWGEFPFVGTAEQRERASLFHPWVGRKRFLERLFASEIFLRRYRAELERMLGTQFVPERLDARLDELAALIRPAVAEQSGRRLGQFERAVGEPDYSGPRDRHVHDERRRAVHQLKRFFAARAEEARAQLEGRSAGVILGR
ncbi:MAG: CotH kinase family protein [Verrucomicrobiae bacterium]|nr:CotH kinase family protein [Verrucomicrobiae bacterium]